MRDHDLSKLYEDADAYHYAICAEQRSNLQLVAGNHYGQKNSKFVRGLNRIETVSKTQKIRLTKNHIQRITKIYRNEISAYAPGVAIKPQNPKELADAKSAELHDSVWDDMKVKGKYAQQCRYLIKDFIDIGEVFLVCRFDWDKGEFEGYEPKVDDEGEVLRDDAGKPIPDPIFAGSMVWDRVLGFNMLTDPSARSWEEVRYCIVRRMVDIQELKKKYAGDQDILEHIERTAEQTYKVFDASTGGYDDSDDMAMVREYYFRPCVEYPEGYFYIAIEDKTLHEGKLPGGIWPIARAGFDELPTSARAESIIKVARPYQAECNRAASKVAEHQITIGDDKLAIQNGGTVSAGGTAHGVKTIRVNGGQLTVIPGRTGEQYVGYMKDQIAEMYEACNVREIQEEKQSGVQDPMAMLFRSIKDKKRFSLYTDAWVEFLKDWCMISMKLAKHYYTEEMLIPIIGKREIVNIEEFKNADDIGTQIEVEEQSEDVESKMGRHITMSHMLQYVGNSLDPRELGVLLRAMPYFNKDEVFSDLTIESDNIKNDILSLDRGKYRPAEQNDDHDYHIKHLTRRMRQPDFEHIDPQIQQMYEQRKQEHLQIKQQQIQAEQAASAGFIPSQGMLVTVDYYVQAPDGKQKRLRLPAEAIQWLVEKLEGQGSSQQSLEDMNAANVQQMMMIGGGQNQAAGNMQ